MSTTNQNLVTKYIAIAVFAVFIGSQITEGVLLVPYWQSLSAEDFYAYYSRFGPSIGRFYTILTVVAALIPIAFLVRCLMKKQQGIIYAILSAFFAILFILCFYIYFKGVNGNFYQSSYSEADLVKELVRWSYWHWSRIAIEILSLIFLILAFSASPKKENSNS